MKSRTCEEIEREGECEVLEGEGVGQEKGERVLKREEGAQPRGRETTRRKKGPQLRPLHSPVPASTVLSLGRQGSRPFPMGVYALGGYR